MPSAFWRLCLCFLVVLPLSLRGAPLGHALDFDGVDDSVEIVREDGWEGWFGREFTIGAWVYLRSGGTLNGKRTAVLSAADCGSSVELLIRAQSDNPNDPQFLELGRCGVFTGRLSTVPVPMRTWTHVAVTATMGGEVRYFVNGQPAGSWTAAALLVDPAALAIGKQIRLGNNDSSRQFDGRLDEVLILSQVLDPATLEGSYNGNFTGTEFPFMYALYSFDEGSGTQLRDGAPAFDLAHGNLVGGPTWVRSGPMPPAVITYEGTHQDLGGTWRSSGIAKTRDVDGDHVLGTDGYQLVNLPPAKPSYFSTMEPLTGSYSGNASYAFIDDPLNPGATFMTGTQNPAPGAGRSADVFRFTLNAQAVGRLIRVGVLIDHLDNAAYNPASLRLVQTVGGVVGSPSLATASTAFRNRVPDWVFFDIVGGQTGDTFVLRGTGGPNGEVTVGGVVFDSLGSIGGGTRVVQGGTPSRYPSRLFISGMGGDIGKVTLTLNKLKAGSPGFGVLLVGPGGQKLRPMVSAEAGFNPVDGVTLTFDDFAAEGFPSPLEGTIPSGVYRPQSDQGLAGNLAAPAPAGPYSSKMDAALDGPLNGVWTLYASGFSGLFESWSLGFVAAPPPTVVALPASDISPTAATLQGTVRTEGLQTTVWFEWVAGEGLQFTPTESVLLPRGRFDVSPVRIRLSGLEELQLHQFYLAASNSAGVRFTPILKFHTGSSRVLYVDDSGPASLRAVIDQASDGAVIDLRHLSGAITLQQGPLRVRRNLSILGPGAKRLAIRGGGSRALLENSAVLTITGLTLREGVGEAPGGLQAPIVNRSILTLVECAITENRDPVHGFGAILNLPQSSLFLRRCTLSGNRADSGSGGALYASSGSVADLWRCTLAGNSAARDGGAIYSVGWVNLRECTVSSNTANVGGAIMAFSLLPGPTAAGLRGCLVAGNRARLGPDVRGDVLSGGNNLIGIWDESLPLRTQSASPDRVGTWESPLGARLLPLADNGGPTFTMALLPDSPAVDTGENVLESDSDSFDQRGPGFARVSGFRMDVGAYELQVADPETPTLRVDPPPPGAVDGLYLSWSSPRVGNQPVRWPLYRKTSLEPGAPWILVEATEVYWDEPRQRWGYATPWSEGSEFYRLGRPLP